MKNLLLILLVVLFCSCDYLDPSIYKYKVSITYQIDSKEEEITFYGYRCDLSSDGCLWDGRKYIACGVRTFTVIEKTIEK